MERQLNLLLSIQELCYQITMFTQHNASCYFVSHAKSIDVSVYENNYDSNTKRTFHEISNVKRTFHQIEKLYEQTESEATKKEVLERLRKLKMHLENTLKK